MAGIGIGRHDYLWNDTYAQNRIVRNGFRSISRTTISPPVPHSSAGPSPGLSGEPAEQLFTLDLEAPFGDLERFDVVLHPCHVTGGFAGVHPIDR